MPDALHRLRIHSRTGPVGWLAPIPRIGPEWQVVDDVDRAGSWPAVEANEWLKGFALSWAWRQKHARWATMEKVDEEEQR